ncbi:DNA polymerase III subunit epsilon [Candidatus Megaera polyxenophila]|nr:DNA polymerase III subunit epsilon [Rickettsiales bacterium]WPX98722.1 DNA polymerase III subunit epsilon [Candidatus Megaera polyxenophila]
MREIILDTETTGLDPRDGHKVIEIGGVEMINKVLTGNKFHCYVNPERDVPQDAYRIHGISSEFLQDKPLFKDIAHEFINFINNAKLVIHNAQFDIKFLNYELTLLNLPSIDLAEVIDTLIIAKRAFPGARVNLDALCKRFKVDNTNRQFHGALKDAYLLSEVYVELSGGRQVSFSLREIEENIIMKEEQAIKYTGKGNRIIITPTDNELKEHNSFLSKFINLKPI